MTVSLQYIQRCLSLYGLPILYILGTIGNLFLMGLLSRRNYRRNPCSLYLLSAAVVNFILIQCMIPLAVYSTDRIEPQHFSLAWCKIRNYLFHALLMLSRWYKMVACVDRAVMCSRHVWIRNLSDARTARRAILIITSAWLLIPVHLAVFFRIESNRCVPHSGLYGKLFSMYSIIISGWFPLMVMICFGLIAYRNLKQIKRHAIPQDVIDSIRVNHLDPSMGRILHARNVSKRDQQLIVILISEVIFDICTNLLHSIHITYLAITTDHVKSPDRIQIESFIGYLSTPFLILINNCLSLYLYLAVSSKFRKDVQYIFRLCSRSHVIAPDRSHRPPTTNQIVAINGTS